MKFECQNIFILLVVLVNFSYIKCDKALVIVSREEWGARKPKDRVPTSPAVLVVIHHTYIPEACVNRSQCSQAMRSIQNFHMKTRGWNDFAYNFAIGGDAIYEGRGWEIMGAHTKGHNNNSLGVVFIGNYQETLPSKNMLLMGEELLKYGLANHHIQPNYQLAGHRQFRDTECPGEALYGVIQTWNHWVPHPSHDKDDNSAKINGACKHISIFNLITLGVIVLLFTMYNL